MIFSAAAALPGSVDTFMILAKLCLKPIPLNRKKKGAPHFLIKLLVSLSSTRLVEERAGERRFTPPRWRRARGRKSVDVRGLAKWSNEPDKKSATTPYPVN
jgi:hypothetical protein